MLFLSVFQIPTDRIHHHINIAQNYHQKQFRTLSPVKEQIILVRQKPSLQKILYIDNFSKYINDQKVLDVPPTPRYQDLTIVLEDIPLPVIAAPGHSFSLAF